MKMQLKMNSYSLWRIMFIVICYFFYPDSINYCYSAGATNAANNPVEKYDSLVNHFKISNNKLAIQYAHQALDMAVHSKAPDQLVVAYKLLGVAYFQNQKDSSFYFYNLAAKIADSAGLQELKIIILYNLAALHNFSNYYTKAIMLLDSSIRLAQFHQDYEGISNGFNMLGLIKVNTHDYENARQNFLSALNVARDHNLYEQIGVALSNLSRSVFEPDKEKSLVMQREALSYLKRVRGTEEEMATILINIGNRFTRADSAIFYYNSALALAENANLPRIIVGAYNNMTYIYLEKGDISAAETCIRDYAIPVAQKGNYHDWLSTLYDTYADVCEAKGDLKTALKVQKLSLKERIEDYKQKAADQVLLLSAQLELQSKELIIQNEEKKILLQQNQLQKTELILSVVALVAIIALFTLFYLQHRNKVRFHQEKIESARRIIEMEEGEKGRTARELHDLTGQLVLGISGMIENIEFPEPELKQEINFRIKELGSSIRRISHRMNRAMIEHFTFEEMIEGLCKDYQKLVGLKIKLSVQENLPELPHELVLHFYRILQELLTNAGKYARDSEVVVGISRLPNGISLVYSDKGPGFKAGTDTNKGMGMRNIHERVKLVNGSATIESEPGKGIKWNFSFPVSNSKNNLTNTQDLK